jgi:hypothetical protein
MIDTTKHFSDPHRYEAPPDDYYEDDGGLDREPIESADERDDRQTAHRVALLKCIRRDR